MAGEINSIPAGKMPSTIDQTADFAKGLGLSDKATETIKNIAALLGGRNVSVNTNPRADGAETGRPTGSTGVPALDNPADIKQLEQNLEKLLSYIQMDNEERQTAMAKDRIDMQKDALDAERNNRSEKIEKSLKDMDKAAESRKASKIFGWLMTALAVVAAVVACVATGGLAVGPVIGAAIAIGCQVLNETGVMDKIVEKLAKGLEGMGQGHRRDDGEDPCRRRADHDDRRNRLRRRKRRRSIRRLQGWDVAGRRLGDREVHHRAQAAPRRVRGGTQPDPPDAPAGDLAGGGDALVRDRHADCNREQHGRDGVS